MAVISTSGGSPDVVNELRRQGWVALPLSVISLAVSVASLIIVAVR